MASAVGQIGAPPPTRRIAIYDLLEEGGVSECIGECAGDEESARQEDRRAGEPVADEAAHLWTVGKLVSAVARNSNDENVLEATE